MKILVAIANYGTKNMKYLDRLIAEYKSMSHRIDVVVLSNIKKNIGQDVEVLVGMPQNEPKYLPFAHKKLFSERSTDYDLYVYSEDDTLITEKNINAFLKAHEILPSNQIPGFMRYEKDQNDEIYCSTIHSHYYWVPDSVKRYGDYTFARFTNDHSACFMLTGKQLSAAIHSGGFIVGPHSGSYGILETAATDPYTQCGLEKVICLSLFDDFLLHHLPNQYIGKLGLPIKDVRMQIKALYGIRNGERSSKQLLNRDDSIANKYCRNYYEQEDKTILSAIPDNAKRVLSVGTAWGALEIALMKKGCKVDCIPMDKVLSVRLEAEGMSVYEPDIQMSLNAMQMEHYDCIILAQTLHCFEKPKELLQRLYSYLKTGGYIIITMPNVNHMKVKYRSIGVRNNRDDRGNVRSNGRMKSLAREVRKWFEENNVNLVKYDYISEDRYKTLDAFSMRVFKSIMGSKTVCVGKK